MGDRTNPWYLSLMGFCSSAGMGWSRSGTVSTKAQL